MKTRIENEIRINEGRITEERLSNIAADFLPANSDEQTVIEKEVEIEEMIVEMGGTIVR